MSDQLNKNHGEKKYRYIFFVQWTNNYNVLRTKRLNDLKSNLVGLKQG